MIYRAAKWSMETAGWALEDDGQTVTLTPGDTEAALHISSFTKQAGLIGDAELRSMADKGSPLDSTRSAIRCGDFTGYTASYVADGAHWSVWWLAKADHHLYATYNTHPENGAHHTAVLTWMLSTLRHHGA